MIRLFQFLLFGAGILLLLLAFVVGFMPGTLLEEKNGLATFILAIIALALVLWSKQMRLVKEELQPQKVEKQSSGALNALIQQLGQPAPDSVGERRKLLGEVLRGVNTWAGSLGVDRKEPVAEKVRCIQEAVEFYLRRVVGSARRKKPRLPRLNRWGRALGIRGMAILAQRDRKALENARESLQECRNELAQLHSQRANDEETLTALRAERDRAKQTIAQLRQARTNREEQIQKETAQIQDAHKEEIAEKDAEIRKLETSRTKLQGEHDDLLRRVQRLAVDIRNQLSDRDVHLVAQSNATALATSIRAIWDAMRAEQEDRVRKLEARISQLAEEHAKRVLEIERKHAETASTSATQIESEANARVLEAAGREAQAHHKTAEAELQLQTLTDAVTRAWQQCESSVGALEFSSEAIPSVDHSSGISLCEGLVSLWEAVVKHCQKRLAEAEQMITEEQKTASKAMEELRTSAKTEGEAAAARETEANARAAEATRLCQSLTEEVARLWQECQPLLAELSLASNAIPEVDSSSVNSICQGLSSFIEALLAHCQAKIAEVEEDLRQELQQTSVDSSELADVERRFAEALQQPALLAALLEEIKDDSRRMAFMALLFAGHASQCPRMELARLTENILEEMEDNSVVVETAVLAFPHRGGIELLAILPTKLRTQVIERLGLAAAPRLRQHLVEGLDSPNPSLFDLGCDLLAFAGASSAQNDPAALALLCLDEGRAIAAERAPKASYPVRFATAFLDAASALAAEAEKGKNLEEQRRVQNCAQQVRTILSRVVQLRPLLYFYIDEERRIDIASLLMEEPNMATLRSLFAGFLVGIPGYDKVSADFELIHMALHPLNEKGRTPEDQGLVPPEAVACYFTRVRSNPQRGFWALSQEPSQTAFIFIQPDVMRESLSLIYEGAPLDLDLVPLADVVGEFACSKQDLKDNYPSRSFLLGFHEWSERNSDADTSNQPRNQQEVQLACNAVFAKHRNGYGSNADLRNPNFGAVHRMQRIFGQTVKAMEF